MIVYDSGTMRGQLTIKIGIKQPYTAIYRPGLHSNPKVKVTYGIQQFKWKLNNRIRPIETVGSSEYCVQNLYLVIAE